MKSLFKKITGSSIAKGLLEFAAAVGTMYLISLLFVYISEKRQADYFQVKNNKGTYDLRVYDAQKPAQLKFHPQKLEKRRDNFDYSFARKLLKERQSHSLVQWPAETTLRWNLQKPPAGKYRLSFKYKQNKQETAFSVKLLDQTYQLAAKPSKKWRTLKMEIELTEQQQDCWLILKHSRGKVDFNSFKLELPKKDKKGKKK